MTETIGVFAADEAYILAMVSMHGVDLEWVDGSDDDVDS